MQHWPTFAGPDVVAQPAPCGLSLGSGWAAAALFDVARPSRKASLRAKTRIFAGTSLMEPTGIEPVTSCLQSKTAPQRIWPVLPAISPYPSRSQFPVNRLIWAQFGWVKANERLQWPKLSEPLSPPIRPPLVCLTRSRFREKQARVRHRPGRPRLVHSGSLARERGCACFRVKAAVSTAS
jgi:hypothetical protein